MVFKFAYSWHEGSTILALSSTYEILILKKVFVPYIFYWKFNPSCPSVGWMVCHIFLKERVVTLLCAHQSTCFQNFSTQSTFKRFIQITPPNHCFFLSLNMLNMKPSRRLCFYRFLSPTNLFPHILPSLSINRNVYAKLLKWQGLHS